MGKAQAAGIDPAASGPKPANPYWLLDGLPELLPPDELPLEDGSLVDGLLDEPGVDDSGDVPAPPPGLAPMAESNSLRLMLPSPSVSACCRFRLGLAEASELLILPSLSVSTLSKLTLPLLPMLLLPLLPMSEEEEPPELEPEVESELLCAKAPNVASDIDIARTNNAFFLIPALLG